MEGDDGEREDVIDDFLYAARTGDEPWLFELLAARPDLVTSTDQHGNTAIHFACANAHNEIVRILLKRLPSKSPQNAAGNTPLHWACLNNHVDTVKLLIEEGADMYLKNNAGRDSIWEAEQRGNEDLAGWMLAFGDERAEGNLTVENTEENTKGGMIEANQGDNV